MNLEKFEKLSGKMNRITEELTKSSNIGDELLVETEELSAYLNQPSVVAELPSVEGFSDSLAVYNDDFDLIPETRTLRPVQELAGEMMDPSALIQDFNYMRELLKETTENSKKVLASVTEELVYSDGEQRAGLVMAFSELNKAQIESVKMFMQSYKEVSTILVNLTKVQNQGANTIHTTNVLNVSADENSAQNVETISTADIVGRLLKKT